MRVMAILALISMVLLAGCTGQITKPVVQKNLSEQPETKPPEQATPQLQKTSSGSTAQETQIDTSTTVDVTKTMEEPIPEEPSEPKTFHVDVVQGIGIKEGA